MYICWRKFSVDSLYFYITISVRITIREKLMDFVLFVKLLVSSFFLSFFLWQYGPHDRNVYVFGCVILSHDIFRRVTYIKSRPIHMYLFQRANWDRTPKQIFYTRYKDMTIFDVGPLLQYWTLGTWQCIASGHRKEFPTTIWNMANYLYIQLLEKFINFYVFLSDLL